MSERYKLGDIDNEQFYQLPKALFTNPFYKNLPMSAKVMYALLRDRFNLSRNNGWVDENDDIFFIFAQEELQEALNISHPTCVKAMKKLVEYDLLDIVRQGLNKPNKLYIKKLKIFTSMGSKKTLLPDVKKVNANKTELSKTELSKTELSKTESIDSGSKPSAAPTTKKHKERRFVKPTVEEIRAYCEERGNNIDPEYFYDHYEANGWMRGNTHMKDWKASVRTWERNNYGNQPRRMSRAERQRAEDAELERMCKEYDSRHGETDSNDTPWKLPG